MPRPLLLQEWDRVVGDDILKEKTFTTFLFWLIGTSQLSNRSQSKATGRCPRDAYEPLVYPFGGMPRLVLHIGVGYLGVARSDYDGQCEGLYKRDE